MKKLIKGFFMIPLFTFFFIPGCRSENAFIPIEKHDSLQASLSGTITGSDDKAPISGAVIYFPQLKRGTSSDENGFYSIKNLPRTRFLIQVSYLGYKTILEKINLDTTSMRSFILNPSVTEIKELVIIGSSLTSEIKRSPVPISIMERKEMNQVNSTNIIDALTLVPGVSTVTTGPNISKPFIHGMGFNRVLTLIDGIRQEGQQWGDEHGVEVDENSIGKVEVIKGPASLVYGSDALAGVVNLLTYPPALLGEIRINLTSFMQTNNKLMGSSLAVDGNKNGFIWGGRLSYKMAGNYRNRIDGRVYGTSFRETDAEGYCGLNKNWGYSHLTFSAYHNLQMIPDGSRDSVSRRFTKKITEADSFRPIVSDAELNSYTIGVLHQRIQHYRINSLSSLIFGDKKLDAALGYQQNIRQEFSHPEAASIAGLYLILKTFTYNFKYSFPEKNNWEASIGMNGMAQKNNIQGTEFIIPEYFLFDFGPFLFLKRTVGKFDFSGGIRYDTRYFSNQDLLTGQDPVTGFTIPVNSFSLGPKVQTFRKYTHTYSGVSGSFGVTFQIDKYLTLKTNVSRGYRAPNVFEITANGAHPGTNIYQIGNVNFNPEFSLQKDIGIYYSKGHFEGSFEIFDIMIDNYIFNQKILNHAGGDSIIVPGNQTFKFQQSKAHLYGGEMHADIHPHPLDWIHFQNSISYVAAQNKGSVSVPITKDSKYLPFTPPLHWHSEIRADIHQKSKIFTGIYVSLGLDYYARQNRVYLMNNTETPTPEFTLFNAGIGSDLTNRKKKNFCSIHLSVSNLFDVAYQTHLSRLKYFEPYPNNTSGHYGIYDMGRNIGVKIEFRL